MRQRQALCRGRLLHLFEELEPEGPGKHEDAAFELLPVVYAYVVLTDGSQDWAVIRILALYANIVPRADGKAGVQTISRFKALYANVAGMAEWL